MSVIKDRIVQNIQKNGFPDKKVSLPFRPVLDACKKEDTKLSEILKELKGEGIFHTMAGDKIIFHDQEVFEEKPASGGKNDFGVPDSIFSKAMEQMKNMDPEQLKEIQDKVKNMSPEERDTMLKMAKGFKDNG